MAKSPTAKPDDAPVAEPAPAKPRKRVFPATGGSIVLNKDGTPKTDTKEG